MKPQSKPEPKKMGQVFAPKSGPAPAKKSAPQPNGMKFGMLPMKGAKKC